MIKETKQNKPKPKTFLENSFKKPSLSCSYYSTSKITNATSLNTHYDEKKSSFTKKSLFFLIPTGSVFFRAGGSNVYFL